MLKVKNYFFATLIISLFLITACNPATGPDSYSYKVTFDSEEATTAADPSTMNVVSPDVSLSSLPSPPVKTGYLFGGWYTQPSGEGTEFTTSFEVTTDITVYANWENYTYTVSYDDMTADTPVSPTTDTVSSPQTTVSSLPSPPQKTEFIFNGWWTLPEGNGTEFTAATPVTGDITVYADWYTYSHTVSYDSQNADTPASPETDTVDCPQTSVTSLPTQPQKDGYIFNGWWTLPEGNGTEFTVSTTVTEDITVYADWVKYYIVTFHKNDDEATGTMFGQTLLEDITTTLNSCSFSKIGWIFQGWATSADGEVEYTDMQFVTFNDSECPSDLYARWAYDFSSISYRDMVPVTGVYDDSYIQKSSPGPNPFTHNISDFIIAKYEVTYELWYEVKSWADSHGYTFANDGREGNDGTTGAVPTSEMWQPVTEISWRDAIVWCNAYSEMSGLSPAYTYSGGAVMDATNGTACDNADCNWSGNGFRLPSEGEWQFAASGRGTRAYDHASGDPSPYYSSSHIGDYAWFRDNAMDVGTGHADYGIHNVGTRTANSLGLFDMSGNACEWCWDWYQYSQPSTAVTDYRGPATGVAKMFRGGSWKGQNMNQQVGSRGSYELPDSIAYGLATLRVAKSPE